MKIENFRDGPRGGNILCEYDIDMEDSWGTVYHNWRLVKGKNGRPFVSGPSYSTTDDNGMKKYFPFIEVRKDKKQEFDKIVLDLLSEYTNV